MQKEYDVCGLEKRMLPFNPLLLPLLSYFYSWDKSIGPVIDIARAFSMQTTDCCIDYLVFL